MNRQILYRLITLAVPLLCIFVAAIVIFYEIHRLSQLRADLNETQKHVVALDQLVKEIQQQPPSAVLPADVQSPTEQPRFLTLLRAYADASHVQLTRWSNAAAAQAPVGGAAKSGLPSGVAPITSAVEISGAYNDVRAFLYRLIAAPRLFSMSDMVWARADKGASTLLKFNLTRYVAPAGSAPPQNMDTAYKAMDRLPDPFHDSPDGEHKTFSYLKPPGLSKEPVVQELPILDAKADRESHSPQNAAQERVR